MSDDPVGCCVLLSRLATRRKQQLRRSWIAFDEEASEL